MALRESLTAERLRELLDYDPQTGVFTRRVALSNRSKVGERIGSLNEGDGYLYGNVDGDRHAMHRLAWLYVTGEHPKHQINHRDECRTNNRFGNLMDRPKAVHLAARFEAYAQTTRHGLPKDDAEAAALLRTLVVYEKETGLLRWIAKPTKYANVKVGDVAGSMKQNGYVNTAMFGVTYPTHRLVWLYVTGKWPSLTIDHRDTNRSNNRFWNLRDVTQQVNAQNQRRAMSTNRSGLLGAHWDESIGKFKPRIRRPDGKYQYLGVFATAELAHLAYVAAKRLIHEGSTL